MNNPIVFFDGECYFCNRMAHFILSRSKNLFVASLQSDIAKTLLNQNYAALQKLNTLVLLDNNSIYIKSDAILLILRKMNGLWPILNVFRFVPVFIRDKLYDIFANNRQRWFKQNNNCQYKSNSGKFL